MGLLGDEGLSIRNTFEPLFADCGIRNTQTGTWESPAVEPDCAAHTLSNVLTALAGLADGQDNTPCMKHFWVYLDKVND